MPSIPRRVEDRLTAGLKSYQPVLRSPGAARRSGRPPPPMKTLRHVFLLCGCLWTVSLFGAVMVEAPVTVSATITSTQAPVYTTKGATLTQSVLKIGNNEILKECVARRLISSTAGWSIVCYYDAQMTGVYTATNPAFRLRHTSGKTVSLRPVLDIGPIATTGSGKATYSGSSVSGTLSRRLLFYLDVNYQGYVAHCGGAAPVTLRIAGTTKSYYGIASPVTVTVTGYLNNYYEVIVDASIKLGTFKRL